MKVCVVGSLVPTEIFDEIVRKSRSKPSNAPENFQMMLAKGLAETLGELTVISFPTMACFPNGAQLHNKRTVYTLPCKAEIIRAPMLNIQGLKLISISRTAEKELKKWVEANKDEEKIIISYSDFPPYADACRKICNKYPKTHSVLLMTDLPTFSLYEHKAGLYSYFMEKMDAKRIENYDKFDAYILLTEHMKREMRIETKPCVIVEGFSDSTDFGFEETKHEKKTLMYAGALSDAHNIKALVQAFARTKIDAEFHIYGSGNYQAFVENAAEKDKRICYFGKVSRNEMLHAQKKATLLVSAKATNDSQTKFAFPSKILEYMTSGTAVLTTKVGGIPDEYFGYVYTIEDESEKGIAEAIEKTLSLPAEELCEKGKRALEYVTQRKNYRSQCEKITDFLNEYLEK